MKIDDYIKRDELRERLDSDLSLFNELVGIFDEDSNKLLAAIEEALRINDAVKVGKAAHTIKGAVSNFSAFRAYEAALALEKIGKSNDLTAAPAALETLKQEVAAAIEAMKMIQAEKKL